MTFAPDNHRFSVLEFGKVKDNRNICFLCGREMKKRQKRKYIPHDNTFYWVHRDCWISKSLNTSSDFE